MKKEKKNNDTLGSLYTKLSTFAAIIIVAIVGFVIAPKEVINNNQLYTFSASISSLKSLNPLMALQQSYAPLL